MNFAAFIEDIQRNNWNVHGVEVYEKGQLIHSYGDTDDNIYDIYSATKTVLSLAAGLAYDRDLINLNESIIRYLPADKVANMSSSQKEIWSKISIKRLLTMSVDGLPFRPEGESYIDYSLSCIINKPDEAAFNYCNICAYLVGVALTEAFQEDLARVIEYNIFKPLGIEKYEYGRSPEGYFYDGKLLSKPLYQQMTMVFQTPYLLKRSVYDNIAYPLQIRHCSAAEIRQKTEAMIGRLGIEKLADQYAHKLSGGESQKVALARALIFEPDLVLLDEPMSGIDAASVRFMEEMIQEYVREYHKTVIMITHNARQAQELCDRIVHLHGAAGGK